MQKVVKCRGCGQYFMQTKKDMQCPFCHTNYVETAKKEDESKLLYRDKNEKDLQKPKESFKIWKN